MQCKYLYPFSWFGRAKWENERWKMKDTRNREKKMKTKSEMKLEKLKLMKDKPQKGLFHATRAIVSTKHWEKRMWKIFQNYNMWWGRKANLYFIWTYALKKIPAHNSALFERANYSISSIVECAVTSELFCKWRKWKVGQCIMWLDRKFT